MRDRRAELQRGRVGADAFHSSVGLTDHGLILGAGSVLVRMVEGSGAARRLALDDDLNRLITLLSVARGEPVDSDEVLHHVETASLHWRRGDKALANFRLLFAGLPRVADASAAERLTLAAEVLDGGTSPEALMKPLWPDACPEPLGKYAIDQPRVQAGHADGGQWTREGWTQVVGADEPPPEEDDLTHGRRDAYGAPAIGIGHNRLELVDPLSGLPAGIGPGPFACKSVPAGPEGRRTSPIQREINIIGRDTRCHICGTEDSGTLSGNFVCDHQAPTALSPPGAKQVFFPMCEMQLLSGRPSHTT